MKTKHRALLLTKDKKIPLLWKVLGNNYKGKLELGIHKDTDGKAPDVLGVAKTAKVLIYPAGATKPVRYEG
jgi:protein disulfide-isomerase A6